jgi:hypothetical protein
VIIKKEGALYPAKIAVTAKILFGYIFIPLFERSSVFDTVNSPRLPKLNIPDGLPGIIPRQHNYLILNLLSKEPASSTGQT